jgi:hypothetical protein
MLEMAVALVREKAGRKEERAKSARLVRTDKQHAAQQQPEPETRQPCPGVGQTVEMEFPYYDLYLMYDYITKELGIKAF